MKTAYFDCFSGAGGDMIVASLIDAGADPEALREGLGSLGVGGHSISIERVKKQGFAATRFVVELEQPNREPKRNLEDVVKVIDGAKLPTRVRDGAVRIFERLAEAEAAVHGTTIEQVHFHEVGAVDAIIDVVGAVLALELLGVRRVVCSSIPVGSGTVKCEHGILPVPAPATARLLKGVPIASCEETGELTTPTAAAVLTTLADTFGPIPEMTLSAVGCGAGTREGRSRPNLLRVMIGETEPEGDVDSVIQLETNLDDTTPELIGHCLERLLDAGALDVFAVPIHMKKWRTGVVLTVLCRDDQAADMERIVFAQTTTFGIRRRRVERVKLRRRHETVATRFGEIRMKVGERSGVQTASPEFEDCKAAALTHGVAAREVIAAASAAWASRSNG